MNTGINYADMMGNYKSMAKRIVFVWNMIFVLVYTDFSMVVILKDYGSVYTTILFILLVLYIILYLSISILRYVGIKKNIYKLQDGMIIINILKKVLKISGFVLSVVALISSFDIKHISNIFSIIMMVVSIIFVSVQILIEGFKLWIRWFVRRKANNMQELFSAFSMPMLTNNNEEDK